MIAAFLTGALALPKLAAQTAKSPAPNSLQPPSPPPSPQDRVDINHASLDQLLKLPGITPVWAGRIVRFRPYRAKNDLLDRGIVPSAVYGRIREYIIAHRDPK
jgi:competence protein ComEA